MDVANFTLNRIFFGEDEQEEEEEEEDHHSEDAFCFLCKCSKSLHILVGGWNHIHSNDS